jgi:hypothetical protein
VIVDTAVERNVLVWIITLAHISLHSGAWGTFAAFEAGWVVDITVGFEERIHTSWAFASHFSHVWHKSIHTVVDTSHAFF